MYRYSNGEYRCTSVVLAANTLAFCGTIRVYRYSVRKYWYSYSGTKICMYASCVREGCCCLFYTTSQFFSLPFISSLFSSFLERERPSPNFISLSLSTIKSPLSLKQKVQSALTRSQHFLQCVATEKFKFLTCPKSHNYHRR